MALGAALCALGAALAGCPRKEPAPGRPEWLGAPQTLVYGRPPPDYLDAVGGTGIAWSVYAGGANADDRAYVDSLHGAGRVVASNFPTMQGSPAVVGDPALAERVACRDFAGEPSRALWIQPDAPYLPCHNNPEWQDFLRRRIDEHVDGEADAIHVDEIEGIGGHLYTAGFCAACRAAFREHLKGSFSREALRDEFGVADPDGFDYLRILVASGARGIAEDPVARRRREYVRFQLKSRRDQLRGLFDHARSRARRPIAFTGNTVNLGPQYFVHVPLLDFLVYENGTALAGRYLANHLLVRAFDPARQAFMFPNILNLRDILEGGDWPAIPMRYAEAKAGGESLLIPHRAYVFGGGTSTVTGEATVPAGMIGPATAFFRDLEAQGGGALFAEVALLYDEEAVLDDYLEVGYATPWTTTGYHQRFLQTAADLSRAGIPFRVAFRGDGDLVPAPLALDAGVRALVAPDSHRLTADERAALGSVQLVEGADPAARLAAAGVFRFTADPPAPLGLVPWLKEDALVVHVVNYDYDAVAHAFRTGARVSVAMPAPEGRTVTGATLCTPAGSTVLAPKSQGGRVTVDVDVPANPAAIAFALAPR